MVVARSLLSCMGTKHLHTTFVINSRPNGSVHLGFNHFSHISTVLHTRTFMTFSFVLSWHRIDAKFFFVIESCIITASFCTRAQQ